MKRFSLILFLTLSVLSLVAKDCWQRTEHILIKDGLSNNYVHDLKLDSNGRLWIATDSGLDSFDGSGFYCYNSANSVLSSNMINCLWYDEKSHLLWFGTKGIGVGRMDTETGTMSLVHSADSTLGNVHSIAPSPKGHLWLIASNRIATLNPETGQIKDVGIDDDNSYYRCGIDDGNGNLIVGKHTDGAILYNAQSQESVRLVFDPDKDSRIKVNDLVRDHLGRIWISTNDGIWRYRQGEYILSPFEQVQGNEVFRLSEVDGSQLWYVTNRNVKIIDLRSEEVSDFSTKDDQVSVSDIQTIYQDRYGNVWMGKDGNGIDFYSYQPPFFSKIYNESSWGIYLDGEITWIGGRDEMLGFRGTTIEKRVQVARGLLYGGGVLSINGDGEDILYLAVPYHFLQYHKSTGIIEEIFTQEGRNIEALTFFRDSDRTLWITASDGVYTYKNGLLCEQTRLNCALNNQSAHGIRRDKEGKLWVATYENGIYIFNNDYELLYQLNQSTGFISNSVQHLKFDSQGRLWMSTPDGPCCIPDTRYPEQYIIYGFREGLQDTYVRAIQEDSEGNVWMSTNNGISMMSHNDTTFINYNQSDYLPVNNFVGGAVMQSDGGLVFNSIEGLCHCYPSDLTRTRIPKEPRILSLLLLDSGELGNEPQWMFPEEDGVYHLPYDNSSFRLVFGSKDYTESRQMEYEYQIGKNSERWLRCARGRVVFRNLQPGDYEIRIRYRFKGQPWLSGCILKTTVCIDSPWWSTLWAKLFYLLSIVALIGYGLNRYRHRLRLASALEIERKKNIDEFNRNAERLQFFTNITHELKTPLTLIQAPLEEMLQSAHLQPSVAKRIQLVYDSTMRLSNLCNKLLDFRRAETHNGCLKISRGHLDELVLELVHSYEELNTNPCLQIRTQIESPIQPICFDSEVVRSILVNLLSNSMKYTPKGEIVVTLRQYEQEGRHLTSLSVADTGYGIPGDSVEHIFDHFYQVQGPHQASGTGIGLAIVRSLVDFHQADIIVNSIEGEGTTMTILFDSDQTYPNAIHEHSEVMPVLENRMQKESDPQREMNQSVLLLVEDDYQILEFLAESFKSDYRVLKAHNGQEGIDLAVEQVPDLIITDLMMPIVDGNVLCRTLKNDMRTSHIPIIMLTAKGTTADQRDGYEDGADSYLTKPFSLQLLRSRLKNLLQSRAKMASWYSKQCVQQLIEPEASTVVPLPKGFSSYDQKFLDNVQAYIIAHVQSEDLRMEEVAQSMRISHSTLYRKIKSLTGLTGNEYIRKVRILHSAELMQSGKYNVSEAAYRCGFTNLPYFRTSFKEVFGMLPTEYLKSH